MIHGVETDYTLPFAPEQYRLQRKLRSAESDIADLRDALMQVVDIFGANSDSAKLQTAFQANIERFRALASQKTTSPAEK